MPRLIPLVMLAALAAPLFAEEIPALKINGENFVNPQTGKIVRFWGVNLVATYPLPEQASAIAQNLADFGVNLVRPHHNLRPSLDWVYDLPPKGALVTYENNSLEFESATLDRFDHLNAELRARGIYLCLSLHSSRQFRPGDTEVIRNTPAPASTKEWQRPLGDDDAEWQAAITELESWHWQKSSDVRKALPVVDERAARVTEIFALNLLAHVNPYTGKTYAADPQILYWETLNEHSLEYAVICGNRFPAHLEKPFLQRWETYLNGAAEWREFLAGAGDKIPDTDLYKAETPLLRELRARFLNDLDRAYYSRMQALLRGAGANAPLIYSNLWRGESVAQMNSDLAPLVEEHAYINPLVVESAKDALGALAPLALADKPFFIGELNQSESSARQQREGPYRSQLPLATAVYGSLQGWSGICWFAWTHGAKELGADGWANLEARKVSIGGMAADAMMGDHLRTAGIIFREGLVAHARETAMLNVAAPFWAGDYNALMQGKTLPRDGWANVHALRKTFSAEQANELGQSVIQNAAPELLISDTGEIVKNVAQKQLFVNTPRVAAFSGFFGAAPITAEQSPVLRFNENREGWFATVIAVVIEGDDWASAKKILLSQTWIDPEQKERSGAGISLCIGGADTAVKWQAKLTRNRVTAADLAEFLPTGAAPTLERAADLIKLPGGWKELEITRGE